MKTVKCAKCKKDIDKETAYVVESTSKSGKITRKYYCSEEEFKKIQKDREDKAAVYREVLKYFPMVKTSSSLPRMLFVDLGAIASEKEWSGLLEYLQSDEEYLAKWMDKEFKSYDARAKYFAKVVLNRIDRVGVMERKQPIIKEVNIDDDIPEKIQYKRKESKRPSLMDMIGEL